jgi:CRP/FNR family transcriptional regulator
MRKIGGSISLEAGQPLFHEGDPATRVFTLTKGALKLYKLLPDGRRQVTGFLFPGDFLGISDDEEHVFSAEALGATQLCWSPRNRFIEFAEGHPEMERELYHLAAQELSAAQQQLVSLGRKTAEEKLATFFVNLLARAEKLSGHAERMIDLPMDRSDIADYLGLTKETISRILALLKRKRLVRLETLNRIEILDREGLTLVAEGAG